MVWTLSSESDTALNFSQVSIAVGLAGFACVLLLVLFVLINKYGRRSKFGMKGKSTQIVRQAERQAHSSLFSFLPFCQLHHCAESIPPANLIFKTFIHQKMYMCSYCRSLTLYFMFTEPLLYLNHILKRAHLEKIKLFLLWNGRLMVMVTVAGC